MNAYKKSRRLSCARCRRSFRTANGLDTHACKGGTTLAPSKAGKAKARRKAKGGAKAGATPNNSDSSERFVMSVVRRAKPGSKAVRLSWDSWEQKYLVYGVDRLGYEFEGYVDEHGTYIPMYSGAAGG